jgi:hypothetical protein
MSRAGDSRCCLPLVGGACRVETQGFVSCDVEWRLKVLSPLGGVVSSWRLKVLSPFGCCCVEVEVEVEVEVDG